MVDELSITRQLHRYTYGGRPERVVEFRVADSDTSHYLASYTYGDQQYRELSDEEILHKATVVLVLNLRQPLGGDWR